LEGVGQPFSLVCDLRHLVLGLRFHVGLCMRIAPFIDQVENPLLIRSILGLEIQFGPRLALAEGGNYVPNFPLQASVGDESLERLGVDAWHVAVVRVPSALRNTTTRPPASLMRPSRLHRPAAWIIDSNGDSSRIRNGKSTST